MRRALIAAVLLLLSACNDSENAEPLVYVAVGDSITAGTGLLDPSKEAWPHVFRQALPADARMTNLGIPGATVADALQRQADSAVGNEPTLVTVLLGVNDLTHFVPVTTYERGLGDLVRQLRRGGDTMVLLGTIPALDRLPAVSRLGFKDAVVGSAVAAFNAAIGRVAEQEGAVLVDLHAASLKARAEGKERSYVGTDGFHPGPAGHAAIAAVFAEAYTRSEAVALSR